MSVSATPLRDRLTQARQAAVSAAPTSTRLPQPALPHWTRPLIRPTERPRVYAVRSASRAGLTHVVDMTHETCTCESYVFQGRDAYPLGHDLRACTHMRDVEDYEREQAGVPLLATAEMARCVVCGAPAVPGNIHCRETSWGRGYCASRARHAMDDVFGEVL